MELSSVEAARRVQLTTRTQLFAAAVGLLIALRFVTAAVVPLARDESYYWLWSRHLAWGYFDHPPAVAFLIRAGTALLGDTELGVRLAGLVLSVFASLCVWRTASLLLGGKEDGARATLFFNLTVMVTAQTVITGPDAPALACSAALVWALAELATAGLARWWLLAGLFGGLGLLSKYTAFFLGASTLLWLLWAKEARIWLRTPWPWLGGGIAAIVFAPNVIWNAQHNAATFAFQFGRAAATRLQWLFLPRFLGSQILHASPLLFFLGTRGLWCATGSSDQKQRLIAAMLWPGVLYFTFHALHDGVRDGWPSFLYPAFAVAAAGAFRSETVSESVRAAVVPSAALILAAAFGLALFPTGILGSATPTNKWVAFGIEDVMAQNSSALLITGAHGILTMNYSDTAWLDFYLKDKVPVIQLADPFRFPDSPRPTASDFAGTLLYIADAAMDQVDFLKAHFYEIEPLAPIFRKHGTSVISTYHVYRLGGFNGEPFGRIP